MVWYLPVSVNKVTVFGTQQPDSSWVYLTQNLPIQRMFTFFIMVLAMCLRLTSIKLSYQLIFFLGQEVRIFSMRDQIWKVMESPCGFVIEGQGVPLHETLHWVYREGEEVNDQNESFAVIIAFDLTTEEFREMPLPVAWLQEEDSWVALFSCRGCLCLWKYGMRAASASVECWVMETYGVTDSWTRGPNFSISNPPELIRFLRPLLVTETSRVLLRNSADGELELVKIDDQEGNQEEEIVIYMHGWNHGWFGGGTHMIVYEETLLSCQVVEPIQLGIGVKKLKTQLKGLTKLK